jgi:hypothetical protein
VLELSLSELFGFFRTFGEVGERLVEFAISPVSGTLEAAQRELVEAGAAVHRRCGAHEDICDLLKQDKSKLRSGHGSRGYSKRWCRECTGGSGRIPTRHAG